MCRLCIVCTLFASKQTYIVSLKILFDSQFACTSFIQFVHFLYKYKLLMHISCTFIIIRNFRLYNIWIHNTHKFSVLHDFLYTFCIVFVQIYCKERILPYVYMYFLCIFLYFSLKNLCFYHFHFFCWWSIKFLEQDINQTETGIGDKKFSVEMYTNIRAYLLRFDTMLDPEDEKCMLFEKKLHISLY